MVLNDKNNLGLTLTWTTIGAIVTDDRAAPPKPTVADAFKGTPTKELLPAGTLLYKFNDGPLIRPQRFGGDPPPPDMKMSPWWSAVLPYKNLAAAWISGWQWRGCSAFRCASWRA